MRKSVLLGAVSMLCFSLSALADDRITFLVVNTDGKPLADAVIDLRDIGVRSVFEQPVIMDQVDKTFVPEILVVAPGQEVNFPNSDDIRHHVYSFSDPNGFEIKLYHGVHENPVIFEAPGLSVVGCNIHDAMTGFIYVTDSEFVLQTNENGLASVDPGIKVGNIYAWHTNQIAPDRNRLSANIMDLERDSQGRYVISLEVSQGITPDTFQNHFGH